MGLITLEGDPSESCRGLRATKKPSRWTKEGWQWEAASGWQLSRIKINAGFSVFRISPSTSHEKSKCKTQWGTGTAMQACVCNAVCAAGLPAWGEKNLCSLAVFENPFHNWVEPPCLTGTQLFGAGETWISHPQPASAVLCSLSPALPALPWFFTSTRNNRSEGRLRCVFTHRWQHQHVQNAPWAVRMVLENGVL